MYCSSCGTQLPENHSTCPACKVSILDDVMEAKSALRKTILDAYQNEYKDLSDTWRSLDTKAQGGITVAGIFLAAVFAYIEKVTLTSFDRVFLVFAIALLVFTVFLAVKSLMIREVPSPPLGLCYDHYGTGLLSVKDDLEFVERNDLFFYDVLMEWRRYVQRALVDYRHKASYLYPAQMLLLFAAGIVAVLTIGKAVR